MIYFLIIHNEVSVVTFVQRVKVFNQQILPFLSSIQPAFIEPAIVLPMFMLSFIFVIVYMWSYLGGENMSALVFVYVWIVNTYLLLRDDFCIGLVINPRVAVLVWGEAERPIELPED